jgi:hypothetical protein
MVKIPWKSSRMLLAIFRAITRSSARVIFYHRFGPPGLRRGIDFGSLEGHLRYITRNYKPRPLSAIIQRVREGRSVEYRSIAITVDDGYQDFFTYAYPWIERYRVPVTVFPVVDFVDQNFWLWFDAVHYLVNAAPSGKYVYVNERTGAGVRTG